MARAPVGPCAVIALMLLGACTPSSLGVHREAIAGGEVTTGDPAVFVLDVKSNTGIETLCSATLIAPFTLITAAHCVDPANVGGTQLTVRAANTPTRAEATFLFDVVEVRRHPAWNPAAGLEADLAMLRLSVSPPVTPVAWTGASLSAFGGSTVRAVGYGSSGPDAGMGTKRTVELTIRQLTPDSIVLGDLDTKGLCHGDSGGPTFANLDGAGERLVGVHSFTRTDACNDGADVRLDAYGPFIQEWLSDREDTCGADGVCSPTPCVGAPDVDCRAAGTACTTRFECPGRVCEGDDQHPAPYCSAACAGPADCTFGLECGPMGRCVLPQRPLIGDLERCRADTDFCAGNGLCVTAPGDDGPRCHRRCTLSRECIPGQMCEAVSGGSVCTPPPPLRLPLATVEGPVGCAQVPGALWLLALLLFRPARSVRAATPPGNC
jgi:V8-like Glu-specific endopeptidase